jgi:hypothetical protein
MKNITSLLLLLTLLSCEPDSPETFNNQNTDCDSLITLNLSDEELYDIAYSEIKYYDGFYTENIDSASIYFENTISVYGTPPWKKLCTDDYDTALSISEQSSLNSSYYRELIATNENEKYYEFRRENPEYSSSTLLSRVLKCSYLNCSLQETIDDNYIVGTFNKPINIENCTELVEFWNFIHSYNWSSKNFICHQICEDENNIYIILYATDITGGDWGINDEIHLKKHINIINKSSGLYTIETLLVKQIEGDGN